MAGPREKVQVIPGLTLILGLGLTLFGTIATWAGLIRLGWMRHGASATDLGFLHLAWIFKPSLPYWGAHMGNLCFLAAFGLVPCVVGALWVALATRSLLRSRLSRPTT
jgi:hypothetical protein